MLFRLRSETEFVDMVDDLAEVIPARNLVPDLAKNFANLIFDRIRSARPLLKSVEVWEEPRVHEIAQIITSLGDVVVELTVPSRRCCPA
jgi:hypothetical protein